MARRKRKSNKESQDKNSPGGTPPNHPTDNPPGSSQDGRTSGEGTSLPSTDPGVLEAGAQDLIGRFPSLSRIISVIMLLIGIMVVGLLFYKVMVGFFIPLFMAAALVVIFRPVNEWFLKKTKRRKRLAAVGTTVVVMSVVLIPVVMTLFVAIGQLTSLVSRTDLNDVKAAMERGRAKLGLTLEHPDRFRRLEELAGMFDEIDNPKKVREDVDEAKELIHYLEQEVSGAAPTGQTFDIAIERLADFGEVIDRLTEPEDAEDTATKIISEERFHRGSVVASASINAWMNAKLGGSLRTQMKLLSHPSEKDFAESVRAVREYIQPRLAKFTGDTGKALIQMVIGIVIMVISVYFFLIDGPTMIRTLMRLSPLDDMYELRLLGEFEKTSRAVVLASVLSAIAQGILAAIAFYFAGLQSIVLLFLVTTVMALIPFLGAASVWVPCVIYVAAVDQRYFAAVVLAIFCAGVVSTIDNVIKAYILHGHSELHPLIALLSVIGGVPVFGPMGILIGPMVVVFLQTLLEILNHELSPDKMKGSAEDSDADDSPSNTALAPST